MQAERLKLGLVHEPRLDHLEALRNLDYARESMDIMRPVVLKP